MTVPRDNAVLGSGWKFLLLASVSLILVSPPAIADSWYEHYFKAEQALDSEEWIVAVEEINGALEQKGDSGARVRSYGMNVVAYFPYLKLGIAYYELDQFDAALQAFETELRLGAISQSDDASAELLNNHFPAQPPSGNHTHFVFAAIFEPRGQTNANVTDELPKTSNRGNT